jgi:hypothetical protein
MTLEVGLRLLGVRVGRQSGSTLLQNLQRVSSLNTRNSKWQTTGNCQGLPTSIP